MARSVFALLMLVLTWTPSSATAERKGVARASERRGPPTLTESNLVLQTLSQFVYGVRSCSHSVVDEVLVVEFGETMESAAQTREPFGRGRLAVAGKAPVVKILRPRVRWRGKAALVDCVVVWDLRFEDGLTFVRTHREQFRLEKRGERYVITDIPTTESLFAQARDLRTERQRE